MRRILVIRGGALGDGLLTVPALAALRTRWPRASVTLVGPRTLLPFATATGLADTALAIEDDAGLRLMIERGPGPSWSDADLAIVWRQDWSAVARRLQDWGCERVLAGPSLPSDDEAVHVADHLFRVLNPVGIGPSRPACPLAVPPRGAETANNWLRAGPALPRTVVALHPGSGGLRKCWPVDRYAALAQRLMDRGCGVLICLGPAEAERAPDWQRFAQRHAAAVTAEVDLTTLAGLLCRCAGFVGNDAGVTHLAAALGVPTVAIFGPTDPRRWAPLGRWSRVLQDPGWPGGHPGADSEVWQLSPRDVERACLAVVAAAAAEDSADTKL